MANRAIHRGSTPDAKEVLLGDVALAFVLIFRKLKISFGIKLICPVQPPLQKYFRLRLTQITSYPSPSRPERGAFRDRHGRWAWDAVDAAALARDCVAGRVLTRERSQGEQTNGADADGEVVWS